MNCLWYGGARGSWSQTIVEFLVSGFDHFDHLAHIPPGEGAVVVVKADSLMSPGIAPVFAIDALVQTIRVMPWALIVIVSNEEGWFPTRELLELTGRQRVRIWLQSPSPSQFAHRYLPWGWTPAQPRHGMRRSLDWCFLGQVTHPRRVACVEAFKPLPNGLLITTDGFAKGLPSSLYHETLSASKMAPCPSGPITVDSFRVCEALEMGAIPMLDTRSPKGSNDVYWHQVFDECPLPKVDDWSKAPQQMAAWLADWDSRANLVSDWWRRQRIVWTMQFEQHIKDIKYGKL